MRQCLLSRKVITRYSQGGMYTYHSRRGHRSTAVGARTSERDWVGRRPTGAVAAETRQRCEPRRQEGRPRVAIHSNGALCSSTTNPGAGGTGWEVRPSAIDDSSGVNARGRGRLSRGPLCVVRVTSGCDFITTQRLRRLRRPILTCFQELRTRIVVGVATQNSSEPGDRGHGSSGSTAVQAEQSRSTAENSSE